LQLLDAWRPHVEEVEFLAALRPEEVEEEAGSSGSGAAAGLGDVASSLATQSSRLVDGLRALLGQRAAAAESAALALVADEVAAGAAADVQGGERAALPSAMTAEAAVEAEADMRAQEDAAQWTPDHARLLCTENEVLYALQARLLREVRAPHLPAPQRDQKEQLFWRGRKTDERAYASLVNVWECV
jgi:hypothetical protein